MRVTETAVANEYLSAVNLTREQIVKLQSQLATGKRVLAMSDDPEAGSVILRLRAALDENAQYQKNVAAGQSMMEETSSALDGLSNLLNQAKETLTQAGNGSQTESYPLFADQLDQIIGEAVDLANTKFNGKYIFGGTNTLDVPYTLASDHSAVTKNPNGVSGAITYAVGNGVAQQANIDGDSVFQGTTVFDTLIRIKNSLQAGTAPSPTDVDAVTSMIDNVNACASKAGVILQSFDIFSSRLADENTQLMSLQSDQQDTDVAEATLKLKTDETMLDAALNTGAQILPMSLLDFLK